MVTCFQNFDAPLTDKMLFDWHKLVCNGRTDIKTIGAYRDHDDPMQVVSGPIQKPIIPFEAPRSSAMSSEMSAFVKWFTTSELPALTKTGLAHLHFVSIHPFEDGNGRIAEHVADLTGQLEDAAELASKGQSSNLSKPATKQLASGLRQQLITCSGVLKHIERRLQS